MPVPAPSPAPSSSPMSASSPAPSSSPMSAPSPAPAPKRHQQPSQSPFELHPHESAIPLDGMLVVPGTSSGTPIQRFSPEKVRPYPKAGLRKENKRRGRKRSTAILTNTPVKAALEEETRQRGQKKQSSSKRPKKTF
ncbi:hypothetical protein GJAV_G00233890 [Gymnothorax javanicus]|nr:hypothetical protein GJAV_G00233890 [Gymnothorax javanicus]